jgi:hypothetical protein
LEDYGLLFGLDVEADGNAVRARLHLGRIDDEPGEASATWLGVLAGHGLARALGGRRRVCQLQLTTDGQVEFRSVERTDGGSRAAASWTDAPAAE